MTLVLEDRAFACYDAKAMHWMVEPGSFTLRMARSAADPGLAASISRASRLMLPV